MKSEIKPLVVHMVGNAHLDPAWLWLTSDGVDEALATCRSACDLLDLYPELHITRGEAWVYEQIRRLEPQLFRRIAEHIHGNRWHVVNGWWVQPDCNLPREESFLKQNEIGGQFFEEAFGIKVSVGYNVDSFGHAAMLPTFLRRGGKNAYLFTRPSEHEMALPSNLFRWRSPVGDTVLAFRPKFYFTANVFDLEQAVKREIALARPEVGHTLCMFGIGDHGGGPTRLQVDWIKRHHHFSDGVELRFSHPRAFFDCIESEKPELPVVEGELHYHAVGCYPIVRKQKREARRAECLMLQAEALAQSLDESEKQKELSKLNEAWRVLLYNQFHDILGGSSLESVCEESLDELGLVKTLARDFIVCETRRRNSRLTPCPRQRIVVDNPGNRSWKGLVEYEPWLELKNGLSRHFVLLDGCGNRVDSQSIGQQAASPQMQRLLFPVDLPPGGRSLFEIRRLPEPAVKRKSAVQIKWNGMHHDSLILNCSEHGIRSIQHNGVSLLAPSGMRVVVIEDATDTWAHGVTSYDGQRVAEFHADTAWQAVENGPLRGELVNHFSADESTLRWSVQLAEDESALRLRLRLNWQGSGKVVKLLLPPAFDVTLRRDGTPGAILKRPLDGKEYPVMDIVSVEGLSHCLTLVSPDIYAASVAPDGTIGLTLLRATTYAHEGEYPRPLPSRHLSTDQGVHEFDILLRVSPKLENDVALDDAYRLNCPVVFSETTLGMPSGWVYNESISQEEGAIPYAQDRAWLAEELLPFVADHSQITLTASDTLLPRWKGERLLTSSSTIALKLPIPPRILCRLSLAHLSGGSFGEIEIWHNQALLKKIGSPKSQASPGLAVVEVSSATANLDLEIRRQGGETTALGFLELTPAFRDITANFWSVSGPYDYSHDIAGDDAIRSCQFAPEQDGAKPAWKPALGQGDYIDFHALSGTFTGSIHYARTFLHSQREQTALLSWGVDYWLKFWIDGVVQCEGISGQGSAGKNKMSRAISLKKGWNEVLIKVASGSTGNGFWMAVIAEENVDFSTTRT